MKVNAVRAEVVTEYVKIPTRNSSGTKTSRAILRRTERRLKLMVSPSRIR